MHRTFSCQNRSYFKERTSNQLIFCIATTIDLPSYKMHFFTLCSEKIFSSERPSFSCFWRSLQCSCFQLFSHILAQDFMRIFIKWTSKIHATNSGILRLNTRHICTWVQRNSTERLREFKKIICVIELNKSALTLFVS